MTGKGELHENAVDLGVGVQGGDLLEHLLLPRLRGHPDERGGDPDLRAGVDLVAHIDLTCGIVAHEYDREPYPAALVLREGGDFRRYLLSCLAANQLSVDDGHISC